jgi:hypothetical protein
MWVARMRGGDRRSGGVFSYVDLEMRVLAVHPLRPIRAIVDDALSALSGEFAALYSHPGHPLDPIPWTSSPPARRLNATPHVAGRSPRIDHPPIRPPDEPTSAPADRGGVRLDQNHRRPGQDQLPRHWPGRLGV